MGDRKERVIFTLDGAPPPKKRRVRKVVQERPGHYDGRESSGKQALTSSEWSSLFRCRRVSLLPECPLDLPTRYLLALPWVEDGYIRLPTLYRPPLFRSHRGWRHHGSLMQAVYDAALYRAFKRRVGLAGARWPELRLAGWSLYEIARAAGVPTSELRTWRRGDSE